MFDTLDAALYYPPTGYAYFFKGSRYVKYRAGTGPVLLSGSETRRIGIDGWETFPSSFRRDLDAALWYPPNGHAYFFKGGQYLKYRPGEGVVPLGDGRLTRTIGVDGWTTFPASFAADIDSALFYPENGHAYFFKGGDYLKYRPGVGVVPIGARPERRIGQDGWTSFPAGFRTGVDAALDYPPRSKVYFFRGRDYLRWEPGEGVDPRYPRRLGLLHRDHGGWPGLSHLVAGPMVGPVTEDSARLWVWVTDPATANGLELLLDGAPTTPVASDPVHPVIAGDVAGIDRESRIRVLEIGGLSPATSYQVRVLLAGEELDRVRFRTAPAPASTGAVRFAFGSCSDMSKNASVATFEAVARAAPDFFLYCGDDCYYVHADLATGRDGPRPRDWESAERMLRRQVEARNHPQFTALARAVPFFSTWDDHDFGYNNATGTDAVDDWVGRRVAAAVFRAMWPNRYRRGRGDQAIFHSFRWGPVEIFMTDARYYKDRGAARIWGRSQLRWPLDGLAASGAPVKIVVTSGQFLFNRDDQEGHARQAPAERAAVLESILGSGAAPPTVSGRVLLLSGDVHYSELMRLPGSGGAELLELTSSPMRRENVSGNPPGEKEPGSRIWAVKRNGFGLVTIDVQGVDGAGLPTGAVTLEARDDDGDLISAAGRPCRTRWDLTTGALG